MYNSVALNTFTLLCNHHHHPPLLLLPSCKTETLYSLNNHFPFPSPLSPWQPPLYSLSLRIWQLSVSHMSRILQQLSFCDWPISLSIMSSQVVLVVKNPPAKAGDIKHSGLIPGSGRDPGEGHSNPFQYSCLENPMDRGAQRAMVYGSQRVKYNWKQLSTHPQCLQGSFVL